MPRIWNWRWYAYMLARLSFYIFHLTYHLSGRKFFFCIRSVGRHHLAGLAGPLVITPMHKSYVDHFIILAATPFFSRLTPLSIMAADWLFRIPMYKGGGIFRAALWVFGAFPVRGGTGRALSIPLKTVSRGGVCCLYPEGHVACKPGVHVLKTGAALVAKRTGAPILPIALVGAEYFRPRDFFFGRRTFTVVFGKPFTPDTSESAEKITVVIKDQLTALYENHASLDA